MSSFDRNRKRPSEGGADSARPHKRISHGVTTPSSNAASAKDSDLPALPYLENGSRRYDEFKGDTGDGIIRTISGGGALFPTNYKPNVKHRTPWFCPVVGCKKPSFDQCSSLGRHFAKAHRGKTFYDNTKTGEFHPWHERTKPEKDGVLRPIVVKRGFGPPWEQNEPEAPALPAVNRPATVNSVQTRPPSIQVSTAAPITNTTTTAPARSTSRAGNSSTATPKTPAQTTRRSSCNVIDLVSEDEDVQLVFNQPMFSNTTSKGSTQQQQARAKAQTPATASQAHKTRLAAMSEVDNPQELGSAYHHRTLFTRWEEDAAAPGYEDSSSASDSDDDDPFNIEPSGLPALTKNAVQPLKTGTDASLNSKKPSESDSGKSPIWRYLMTLTRTEIAVPDDHAIIELLTLPKRRYLPRTWINRLSRFDDFQLTTLTSLVLYIGGDEATNSPCKWMGCSIQKEVNAFYEIDFNCGSLIDYRGWKKEAPWKNKVSNDQIKAARDAERADAMKNASTFTDKSADSQVNTNIPCKVPDGAALISKAGNHAMQSSPPGYAPLQPATVVRDTTTPRSSAPQADIKSNQVPPTIQVSHRPAPPSGPRASLPNVPRTVSENKSEGRSNPIPSLLHEQIHPPNASTAATSSFSQLAGVRLTAKQKRYVWLRGKLDEKRMKREARLQNNEQLGLQHHSPTSQAQDAPVSAAAVSLSILTVNDTRTAPSTSPQHDGPEQSEKSTVVNIADGSTEFIGLEGEECQLLQASKKQTLECTVWAGSVTIQMVGDRGMSDARRVDVGGTWTVNPDSHCLVNSLSPAAEETAVMKVKSISVAVSIE